MKTKYEEIEKAVKILNLPEEATLRQIKEHYKKLITKRHPDKCKKDLKKCQKIYIKRFIRIFYAKDNKWGIYS